MFKPWFERPTELDETHVDKGNALWRSMKHLKIKPNK